MELTRMNMDRLNDRYPGLQPFKASESGIFFGRKIEIEALFDHIQLNQVSVLFSKSGLGKSSILNAGLIPLLEQHPDYRPVSIRFKAFTSGRNDTPEYITRRNITREKYKDIFLDLLIPGESSFWHDIKKQQILGNTPSRFVLVFDQFEELFTYPEEQVSSFKAQLAELLFAKIPQRYIDIIDEQRESGNLQLDQEQLELVYTPLQVKVLFSVRSDRLHLLNQLSDRIPAILSNAFELFPLTKLQAEDAIINPALSRSASFHSPRFEYSPSAVDVITGFLSNDSTKPIESFQLQIICNALEKKVSKEGLKEISENDLSNLNHLIENYYLDQLEGIEDIGQRGRAQSLIEEGLIFADEQRRVTLFAGQIQQMYDVGPELLEKLINCRLVRAEALPDGGYAYELAHDSLVAPILSIKGNREAGHEKALLERHAEEESRKAQEARQKAYKARLLNIALGTAVVFIGVLFLVSMTQFFKAREAKNKILDFSRIYSHPKLSESIKKLDYKGAFRDIQDLNNSIDLKGDSLFISALFEVAFVSFQTGGEGIDVSELLSVLKDMGAPKINDVQSIDNQIALMKAVQQAYNLSESHYESRYFPALSRPVVINGNSVAFAITETSVWQYYIFSKSDEGMDIRKTASNWGLNGDYPVVKVDWYEAISYANWLSNMKGFKPVYRIKNPNLNKDEWIISIDRSADGYRLPTLQEWRTAAGYKQSPLPGLPFISGPTQLLFPDEMIPDLQREDTIKATAFPYVWYLENSYVDNVLEPHPVGVKDTNRLGLYDMSGNLWEWCEDEAFEEGIKDKLRSVAGGAFNLPLEGCTIDSKEANYAAATDANRDVFNTTGFRLCRTIRND